MLPQVKGGVCTWFDEEAAPMTQRNTISMVMQMRGLPRVVMSMLAAA
jgi:hypothetical protein